MLLLIVVFTIVIIIIALNKSGEKFLALVRRLKFKGNILEKKDWKKMQCEGEDGGLIK